jgi:AraC family transcriptional regulator of adaptative response / DNA-3-methyladenine glycosylase II
VLAEIAAHIGVSPRRLSRLFQEKTGIPFSRWIRWERVSRAKKLLRDSDAAISDVAVAAGFRSTRTFERAFKDVLGITASQFRDEIRCPIKSKPTFEHDQLF